MRTSDSGRDTAAILGAETIGGRRSLANSGEGDGLEKRLDESIRRNRSAAATVTVLAGGAPLADREVTVGQTRQGFLVGSNWGETTIALANGELSGREKEAAERRNELFLGLFNQATLPFYWGRFEGERGKPMTERIKKAAEWYRERGVAVKGHPLCWHTLTAPWLLGMGTDEILKEQKARIRREVSDFAGIIDAWDVVNEAVIMPVFDKYDNGITRLCKRMGRIELIRAMFEEARAANPKATLILNDFDVSPAYDILIEGCLEAGIKIDVVGIQSHMHQGCWGSEKTESVLERFERFGAPIHFTENTIVSGDLMPPEIVDLNDYRVDDWPSTPEGEERQEREVLLHYKTLLAHPSVESITWWDLSDGGWLGAPAGLLRADHSPKPAYDALKGLVKGEWWLGPTKMRTDAAGKLRFTGFLGDYRIEAGGKSEAFTISAKGEEAIAVRL
jgi:endo-1,4-beta-xylanase